MNIKEAQTAIGANAKAKGFWEAHQALDPMTAAAYAKLCLIHSEVTEAMEELRDHGRLALDPEPGNQGIWVDNKGKSMGFWSEVADVVIRCLDMAEWGGADLELIIAEKMAYNAGRPAMHGRKA